MNLDVSLCLPREASTVSLIRGVVSAALSTLGVTTPCVHAISLGLSEACTNVIEHATDDDDYEVRLQVDGDRCTISVTHPDSDFDAEALTNAMPEDDSARGRGVAIMHAVMDHVNFESQPEKGTIVRLVKRLEIEEASPLARLRKPPG